LADSVTDDKNELDPNELLSTEASAASSADRQQIGPYHLLEKIGEGGTGDSGAVAGQG
jgi:hypothetical protein